MPLGMEDHRILSGHLRASSSYNYNHGPDRARLNIYNGHGRTGAWVAKYRNANQWLQIDLRIMSIIKGIATQGRREAHQWVKSYTLSYSAKGLRFRPYVAYGKVKVRWWIKVYDNFSTCQLFLAFFDIEISNSCYMDLMIPVQWYLFWLSLWMLLRQKLLIMNIIIFQCTFWLQAYSLLQAMLVSVKLIFTIRH